MVRKLEKIEKEMGYCEIKLEKEQRLRTQLHFLKLHAQALAAALESFAVRAAPTLRATPGNQIEGFPIAELYQKLAVQRDQALRERAREAFRCAGALPLLGEQHELLEREIENLETKLETFRAFSEKRQGLVSERERALDTFGREGSEEIVELSSQFECIERSWNTLTEDLMNIDGAIFAVTRCVDYLGSAREFVLASRSQFSLDRWLREGYLIDLFKHSTLGRAKEMVEGADRNLKAALAELVCLETLTIQPDDFEHLLLPFLDVLFDDLFVHGKLRESIAFLEARGTRASELRAKLQLKRDNVLAQQLEQEGNRVRVFNEMGDQRKRLSIATP